MKRGRSLLAAGAAAVLIAAALSGCFSGPSSTPVAPSNETASLESGELEKRQAEFRTFLETVNAGRREIYDGKEIPLEESWMSDMDAWGEPFTEDEVTALLQEPAEPQAILTDEEAAEDVETLFRLLRQVYVGYDYFGGDTQFNALKSQILGALSGKKITSLQLENAVKKWLYQAISDCHFLIGDRGGVDMLERIGKFTFYVPDLYFDDPAGIDPALVKRTIDEEGRLRYTIASICTLQEYRDGALPKTAQIEGKTVLLQWTSDGNIPYIEDAGTAFSSERLEDGIPVLTSRTMGGMNGLDQKQQKELDRLAESGGEYAGEYAGEPVLIWDLRSNMGGNDAYFDAWYRGWTGHEAFPKITAAGNFSSTNLAMFRQRYQGIVEGFLEDLPEEPQWTNTGSAGAFSAHKGLTLLLQDKICASSGESSIGILRAQENTLAIGTNTKGALLTGNVTWFYLPHSGLTAMMGTNLHFMETAENQDGTSFLPDLWVPADKALERAERMIRYYDLRGMFEKESM